MGDRGNIVIEDQAGKPAMYFYTHWSGSNLPAIVATALKRGKSRWGDPSYLNRVLFQTLVGKDDGLAGFGIDTTKGDGGTEVYICHDESRVRFEDKSYTFAEFVEARRGQLAQG